MKCLSVVLLLVLVPTLVGCSSTASTKEEFLAGTADTAYAVKEGGRAVFWDVPRFILWTVPKAVVYDLPASLVRALRGHRAQVEALVAALEAGEMPIEEEVAVSAELRELTGIPIHSASRWIAWWAANRDRPEKQWRRAFIEDAIENLTAPGYFERVAAIEDLKAVYGDDLGYDPKASPEGLGAGAARFREYLSERGIP